jgi:signal transduction histidine kinase
MTRVASEQRAVPRWHRPLLPGDLLSTTDARRSARDWVVDSLVFAAAVALAAGGLAETWDDHGTVGLVLDIALSSVACVALWWRRSHPLAVAVAAIAIAAIAAGAGGAALLAVFGVAVRASVRVLAAVSALAVVSMAVSSYIYPSPDSWASQMLFAILALVIAVGWGLFTRVRRELVISLRDRAERLESEQRWHVEQAREAERRRIAREMHDVLAHRLSLLSVHAGALEFRPDAPPEEVTEAAGVIRATAQTALQELRDVIGVLREDSEEVSPEPPQPTLAELPALIEESRAAGMRVNARLDALDGEDVHAALGRTAYRIVQEGLTNARKHAPGATVDVSISADSGMDLVVEVVSRHPVGVPIGTAAERLPGAGTGLVGLTERVELAGGELRYGPDAAGDFVLRATLPWPR